MVLPNFEGRPWFPPPREQTKISADSPGEYRLDPPLLPAGDSIPLHYTVLMEPIATDAIFVRPRVESLQGRFSSDAARVGGARHNGSLILDQAGSLSNRLHNNTKRPSEATSGSPAVPPKQ